MGNRKVEGFSSFFFYVGSSAIVFVSLGMITFVVIIHGHIVAVILLFELVWLFGMKNN